LSQIVDAEKLILTTADVQASRGDSLAKTVSLRSKLIVLRKSAFRSKAAT
jgi:hypothetical protein